MITGRRGKKDFYLLDVLKPQNLDACKCAVGKADIHICLRAASSAGLAVGTQVAAVSVSERGRDELRPEKRADHGRERLS